MRLRGLVLVAVVVLAGCSGLLSGPNPDGTSWDGTEVTVSVDAPTDNESVERRYRTLVRRGLAFWEDNADRYADVDVSFRVVADDGGQVRVHVVENLTECPREGHTAGCAPVLTDDRGTAEPVEVEIRDDFDNESTVRVVEHEFGHVLGLGHDNEPQSVMDSVANLKTTPRPNATERAFPWGDRNLTVAVSDGGDYDRERADEQVTAALDYYDEGADGTVPANVSVRRVDDAERADVVVSLEGADGCEMAGSCATFEGNDPDGDGAFERYTGQRIVVAGLDTDAVAWHTARWLAEAFGLARQERPDPLVDATYSERRSEWWTG